MLQFIPFEDDWDALEHLRPQDLIPYRVGLLPDPTRASRTSSTFAQLPVVVASTRLPARDVGSGE